MRACVRAGVRACVRMLECLYRGGRGRGVYVLECMCVYICMCVHASESMHMHLFEPLLSKQACVKA